MNDVQKEFEKIWVEVVGSWNPMLHFSGDKYYPISASYDPYAADDLNRAWFVFKVNYESQQAEIKRLTEALESVGNILYIDTDGIGDFNEARMIIKETLKGAK